jgi:hypothetical protein
MMFLTIGVETYREAPVGSATLARYAKGNHANRAAQFGLRYPLHHPIHDKEIR